MGKIEGIWAGILDCSVEEIYVPQSIFSAPGFIHSDTIQSCIFPSVMIIVILSLYLDYKPIQLGFLMWLHSGWQKRDLFNIISISQLKKYFRILP